jgi:flagella basal body P-ring formation protein FlgA
MRILFFLCAMMLVCAARDGRAQHAGTRIELMPQASVETRFVTLGAVARMADVLPERLAALRRTVLATAPRHGEILQLSRREVQRLLVAAGLRDVMLLGASTVTVRAAQVAFDEARIVDAAKEMVASTVQSDGQPAPVMLAEELPKIWLPHGEVTLLRRPLQKARVRRRTTVDVDILVDGVYYQTVPVPLNVRLLRQALVARHDLNKGQVLGCADTEVRELDVAALASAPLVDDCANQKRRLRRGVRAGDAILLSELESVPAVSEGERIKLELSDGAIQLEMTAMALNNGQIGQAIAVRIVASERPLLATVVGPGVAQLKER